MAKEKHIEMDGVVVEVLRNAVFKVKLDGTDHVIDAYISGHMRKFQIRVLNGDRVKVALSPYDMTKGCIRFREK